MSLIHQAREVVESLTGMWSPDADEGALRDAARAWRTFADDVDDVIAGTNPAARSLIEHNRGDSIEAFDAFWRRYYDNGRGWLKDLSDGARSMAKALDHYADAVHDANQRIDHELEIQAAVLLAGVGLAVFTFGTSAGAALAAAEAISVIAADLGVAVTTEVATIAATTLTGVVFGGIESVTVDLAIAQPLHIAAGTQKGFNLDEAKDALTIGAITGGLLGGAGATAAAIKNAGGIRNILDGIPVDVSGSGLGASRLSDEWLTGARRRPRDFLDDPEQTRWAQAAYNNFVQDSRDVTSISRNTRDVARGDGSTGFSEDEIASVKKHVFDTEHPIEDYETGDVVMRKFDADAEIADAWIRLRSGNALPEDHILLEHELTELKYLHDHPGATYQEAHRVTNQTYNWQSKVPLNKREDFESDW